MKKFLALVLTLAMVLTMSVSIFASPAAAGSIDVAGKTSVEIEGVTYTVISDLAAITEAGNYILSGNVAIAKNATVTIPAGTVLNGNGYIISVAGNSFDSPLAKAPFVLGAGDEIKITNVKFGDMAAEAPVVFEAVAPTTIDGVAEDVALFAEEGEGVVATFEDVEFSVYVADELVNVNAAAVVAVATGTYTFEGCVANIELDTGNMSEIDGGMLTKGYTGGFVANAVAGSSVSFNECVTNGSIEADWRTGGFVGAVDGAASFTNCTNNAKITNLTLVTGGFVGWVGNDSGNNLSAWTMDSCTNNGEITAYVGPLKAADGKGHGDSGRSAGALVGYVYKCETGTNPQWVVTNCVNTGNIYGEDRLAGMVGDNRLTHQYDKSGTLFQNPTDPAVKVGYNPLPAITTGCINYGDVVCVVKDMISGAHVLGGLISRTQGANTIKNCVNYGKVDANGMKDGHLGGIVGNTSAGCAACYNVNGKLIIEDCVNYGLIINGRRLAGMVGASESPTDFINCVNYGTIKSGLGSSAHAGSLNDNGLLCGGMFGLANNGAHNLTNCVNFGSIEATHIAGGIASCTRNTSYTHKPVEGTEIVYPMVLNIVDCANFGDIGSDDVDIGGIVGQSLCDVSLKNCLNTGKLTAYNALVASQLVCNAKLGIAIENCYMFGSFDELTFDRNADGILGFNCDVGDTIVCPDGAVMAYAIAEEVTDTRNQAITAEAAAAKIQELYPDVPVTLVNGEFVLAKAAISGAQVSTAVTDGKVDVRVIGVTANVEFTDVIYSVKVNGADAYLIYGSEKTALLNNSYSGTAETKDAEYLGGDKIYTTIISGVEATGTTTIEVEMSATFNGAEYKTGVVTITVVDGVIANPAVPAAPAA